MRPRAKVEGNKGFLPQPKKDLESPSSMRLEVRFPYHGSRAITRFPSQPEWKIGTGKDPDAGKDWGQEEKGTTEGEMVGWHH